ncbi:MAG TPA: DUF192 domain-containing protein [Tepidisphaeraceae bacterium]|jgi:hypothetical protein|nr:DUF192 domain-containing protein [Tepidisphaeraceae bacterium]
MVQKQLRFGLAALLAILVAGCDHGSSSRRVNPAETGTPQSGLATAAMKIGSQTFTLEIAATHEQREIGLMYRDSMPADHGMIFVFGQDQPMSFWMKHTRIPLDVIFVNGSGKVVSIHQMQPFDISGTTAKGNSKYAIELNVGASAAAGVKEGDQLEIPAAIMEMVGDKSP